MRARRGAEMGHFLGPSLGCGLGAGSEPRADSAMSGCSATLRKWAARTAADLLRAAAAPLGRALRCAAGPRAGAAS